MANAGAQAGLAGGSLKTDGGLDKALGAAGFAPSSFAGPSAPSGSGVGSAPLPPPPTPEQLVALLSAVNGMACRMAATVYRVKLSKSDLAELCTLGKEEKQVLESLAPYAAEYAPQVMSKVKPAMAWGFVAAYLVMTGTRIWEIRAKRPPKLTRAAERAPLAEVSPEPAAELPRTENGLEVAP